MRKKVLVLALLIVIFSIFVVADIITISEEETYIDAYLDDIIAETNFTHLNISDVSPYDSLVGYWSFDGDLEDTLTTTHYDFTEYNNDGTGVGQANTTSTGCIYDNCAQFDGDGDYINIIDNNLFDIFEGDKKTFAFWINPIDTNALTTIISGLPSGSFTGGSGWIIRLVNEDTGTISFGYNNGTGGGQYDSSSFIVDYGNWQYITIVIDRVNENLTFYKNGVQSNSITLTKDGDWNESNNYKLIGVIKTTGSNWPFNGTIDELMIFNTSLTDQQILGIYNNQSSRFKATGTQELSNQTYLNITAGNDCVNVSASFENNFDSNISLFLGYYDDVNKWAYTDAQNLTIGYINFTVLTTTTNLTLNFTFQSNNTDGYTFYTPILYNLTIEYSAYPTGGIVNYYQTLNSPLSLKTTSYSQSNFKSIFLKDYNFKSLLKISQGIKQNFLSSFSFLTSFSEFRGVIFDFLQGFNLNSLFSTRINTFFIFLHQFALNNLFSKITVGISNYFQDLLNSITLKVSLALQNSFFTNFLQSFQFLTSFSEFKSVMFNLLNKVSINLTTIFKTNFFTTFLNQISLSLMSLFKVDTFMIFLNKISLSNLFSKITLLTVDYFKTFLLSINFKAGFTTISNYFVNLLHSINFKFLMNIPSIIAEIIEEPGRLITIPGIPTIKDKLDIFFSNVGQMFIYIGSFINKKYALAFGMILFISVPSLAWFLWIKYGDLIKKKLEKEEIPKEKKKIYA